MARTTTHPARLRTGHKSHSGEDMGQGAGAPSPGVMATKRLVRKLDDPSQLVINNVAVPIDQFTSRVFIKPPRVKIPYGLPTPQGVR